MRWNLKKGKGYHSARNMVLTQREQARSTFDELARMFNCSRIDAITIYVQEREKVEGDAAEARKWHLTTMRTNHKYDYLINEPINAGSSYAEIVARRKERDAPARAARMKILKAERAERIKKFGKIKIAKMSRKGWSSLGT